MNLKVYTDGGARGNPGSAGIGVYITDRENIPVEKRYKSLGVKTNNQAEYLGALHGIERGIELGAKEIELYMDSQLVINQLSGIFKVKNKELAEIKFEIQKAIQAWGGKISFIHIPREKNKEADRLSNIAMDNNNL
ncbi:MAG: ribonuclease HI family protein [Candidatus Gracilibacteria bacterium]|nr:ribonuclease HI family protein [Candidatus Gracilibacteria bacterium]MDD2908187.1 ribonuclease HI family protein [Candidatus Gracilibacteria bacterium]